MTVTLEQIEENARCLLHEWPKDNGVPFPMEVLDMLNDLRTKVRSRDEEKVWKTGPLTMADPPGEIAARQTNAVPETMRTTMPESQAKMMANEEETTRERCMDAHPMEDDPTN